MDQFFTIQYPLETPPSTKLIAAPTAQLQADLLDNTVRVYVYVGQEADAGWETALIVTGMFPDLKPFLAPNIELLREWVPVGNPSGVVFGRDDSPDRLLSEAEVVITKIVFKANSEAT